MAQLLTRQPSGDGRHRRGRGEEGVAMVIAVVITAVVFTLGAVWVTFAEHAASSSRYARHREQAIDAAHAGLAAAAAALSRDSAHGGVALTDFPGGSAQYEVTVAVDTAEPSGFRRIITSTGYAPSPDAQGRARRTLRQVVDLDPVAFQYAMLSEQAVTTGSSSAIVGDIYANGSISLGNSQDYVGSIYLQGNLATGANQTITGDVHADGDVAVGNSSTAVKGSVYAGGDISTGGTIEDDAVAGGGILPSSSGCDKVGGTCSPNTPPPAVPEQHLPTFTWHEGNYPAGTVHHLSGPEAVGALSQTEASGTYHIVGDLGFSGNDTLQLADDLTIVATGSITLPRQVENRAPGGAPVQLSIISTGGGEIRPANNFTIPSTVRTLMYTTGQFVSSNSSTFTGALYAGSLSNGAHLRVTHAPLDDVGFEWASANPQSFGVRNVSTQEVNL
ncbi:MAG: hypothetical protein GEV08_16140 [Acidimicrobiia bacterium]|nr:hypothetical protein [Acidimicrobiia bacterium]